MSETRMQLLSKMMSNEVIIEQKRREIASIIAHVEQVEKNSLDMANDIAEIGVDDIDATNAMWSALAEVVKKLCPKS